jgi:hypothetical protein
LKRLCSLFGLALDAGQVGQRLAHPARVPEVVDVPGPGVVAGELRGVEDLGAQRGDQHVRARDAVAAHRGQRRVQPATGGDAEAGALAVLAHHADEVGQRVRVAEQVLVQIGEDGAVVIEHAAGA